MLFCVELTVFCVELTGVSNWRFFCVELKDFGSGKEMVLLCWTEEDPFYEMIIMILIQAIGISFNLNKSLVENEKLFNLNLKVFDEAKT